MLRTLHKISSCLLIVLGAVHAALTPVFFGRFSLGALWLGAAPSFPYKLNKTDRYLIEHRITLDDLAIPANFEVLWDALIKSYEGDDDTSFLPKTAVSLQSSTRPLWLHMSTFFGSPTVVPPVAPYQKTYPADVGADRSKIIPDAVTRQLVNKLALHRDGIDLLDPYHHLRLCALCLIICLGRRVDEVLAARRGRGLKGL